MKMSNRVYGVCAIRSIMANWNADLNTRPKTISSGDIFGSDKAFKYPIKRMWQMEGEKVLVIKSYKLSEKKIKGKEDKNQKDDIEKLQPRDLQERYNEIFNTNLTSDTSSKEVLKNLFSTVDVINFGATFAESKQNISITGAVQIGQGMNKYTDTQIETQNIMSPYRNPNPKKEEASQASLGTKIITDEAHYFYPISINPSNYNDYIDLPVDGFVGYTREAYEKFKRGCLLAATAYNTNSKSGCENEFALFVECKDDARLYLPNIDRYVDFHKEISKNVICLGKLGKLLSGHRDAIKSIEVYYNPLDTEVNTAGLICTEYDLFGRQLK